MNFNDEQIALKINLYCRKNETFNLSVTPETSLGQIMQVLAQEEQIDDLPSVDELTYIDYWKTPTLNSNTLVSQLVPHEQVIEIEIKYLQEQTKKSFDAGLQSFFYVNEHDTKSQLISNFQKSFLDKKHDRIQTMADSILIKNKGQQITQSTFSIPKQTYNNQQLQSKTKQIEELRQVIKIIGQYSTKGEESLNKISNKSIKNILLSFIQQIKKKSMAKAKSPKKLNQNEESQSLIQSLQQKIKILRAQNLQNQTTIDNLNKTIKQLQQNPKQKRLQNSNQQLQRKITELTIQNQNLKKQTIKTQPSSPQHKKFKIFKKSGRNPLAISQILHQHDNDGTYTEFILNSLNQFSKLKVYKMDLLCKLDTKSQTNFHSYVDGKQRLLILMYTQNNKCFGAYLQKGISPIHVYDDAFLYSADQKTIFQKREHGVTHQQQIYYLVIGNSDIIMNTRSNKVQISKSLFSKTSSFQSISKKYDIFTGSQDKTQIGLLNYEIYQVHFDH